MKEIVVISGKGGTGKTSLTGSFAALAHNTVIADCDVDAADLHLILNPEILKEEIFKGGYVARIDREKCTQCGKCIELCRYNAISEDFIIDEISCEGCNVCAYFCPVNAIKMEQQNAGMLYVSKTRFGHFVHARLGIAEETSGKLVSQVRITAKDIAKENQADMILVDGSPGIGCPVIASITGADYIIAVTEPTLSGLHDLERIVKLSNHFKVPVSICINKFDINTRISGMIERYCGEQKLIMLGKIPYNDIFTRAIVERKTVIEYGDNALSTEIEKMWEKILEAV